jgi:serine O-acetyltransferase
MNEAPSLHLERFKRDVARWIRPQEVASLDEVSWPVIVRLLLRHPSLRAVGWFRLGSFAKDAGIRGVASLVQRRILRLYGLELSVGARIDGGLYIAHPAGTVVEVERAGRNLTVIAAVTVGMRNEPRWPRIGDNVFIGAGARVLGGIDVGDGALVGANAVVVTDVAPGATMVGIPARSLTKG